MPTMFHGLRGTGYMRSNRYCPECNCPLVWFSEGPLAGVWRIDDGITRLARVSPGTLRPAA